MSASAIIADPNIRFGRFRVLHRTDTLFAVVDEDAPAGQGTVATREYLEDAKDAARACAELEVRCTCEHTWARHAESSPHGCADCACGVFSAAEPILPEHG